MQACRIAFYNWAPTGYYIFMGRRTKEMVFKSKADSHVIECTRRGNTVDGLRLACVGVCLRGSPGSAGPLGLRDESLGSLLSPSLALSTPLPWMTHPSSV